MKAVKSGIKDAQKAIVLLKDKGLFDFTHEIKFSKDSIVIPVSSVKGLSSVKWLKVVDAVLKKRDLKPRTLVDALKGKLTPAEIKIVPRAFDVIGDIAILEIPAPLVKKEKIIAKALLDVNRHMHVVVKKAGIHEGVFRTQKVEVIGGENRKESVCKENNVSLKLNVEDCYFSARLSTERKRVADLVKPNEDVLVMFSGVGPYVAVIAKNTSAKSVYGVEINPAAHKYALENMKINKITNAKLFCGDAAEIVPKLGLKFDRILMPLPKDAGFFLDTALSAAKPNAVIHFYEITEEATFPKKTFEEIKVKCPTAVLLDAVPCGAYAPGWIRGCVDFRVK
ncbi:MAG: class I SAM-dependent methyltransferase family protein [Candidatus Nanoarchaeia archaeon]|jgi:tRNA (guanine37-N1)-methyltransferase